MNGLNPAITFRKSGSEIKEAVQRRIVELEQRLQNRNVILEMLLDDKTRLRSYLVRDIENPWPRVTFQAYFDIPSEDHQEITELCRRIFVLEKELSNLRMILTHLHDEQEFDLTFDQMVSYGFRQEPL